MLYELHTIWIKVEIPFLRQEQKDCSPPLRLGSTSSPARRGGECPEEIERKSVFKYVVFELQAHSLAVIYTHICV